MYIFAQFLQCELMKLKWESSVLTYSPCSPSSTQPSRWCTWHKREALVPWLLAHSFEKQPHVPSAICNYCRPSPLLKHPQLHCQWAHHYSQSESLYSLPHRIIFYVLLWSVTFETSSKDSEEKKINSLLKSKFVKSTCHPTELLWLKCFKTSKLKNNKWKGNVMSFQAHLCPVLHAEDHIFTTL